MAEPVRMDLPNRDPREELRYRLERAPVEHAEAVLAGYRVLQGLYDTGNLEFLQAVFGSSDKILADLIEAAKKPESIRAIRNFLALVKLLGTVEPELLEGFVVAFPDAIAGAGKRGTKPPGFWMILNKFRSEDLRRGLDMINRVLEAWGRSLSSKSHH